MESKPATKDYPNIILISVDTLRADHLGTYGYEKNTSPNIDAFAKNNFVFKNAHTPIPCTYPSYTSLFTGVYPNKHQDFGTSDKKISYTEKTGYKTLTEKLKDNGYNTAAYVSSALINPQNNDISRGFQLYDGVDSDDKVESKDSAVINNNKTYVAQSAERTTEQVTGWLNKNENIKNKFFLFVHYVDPHWPYGQDEPFADKFGTVSDNKIFNTELQKDLILNNSASPEQIESLINLYDEDIAYTDHHLGVLLNEIKAKNLDKNSIIIITADHGESFDHNALGHCMRLYQSEVNIPLIYHDPVMSGGVLDQGSEPVSLIDIYPTLMARLKIDAGSGLDGVDIGKLMRGEKLNRSNVYAITLPPWPEYFRLQEVTKGHAPRFLGQLYGSISDNQKIIYNEISGKSEAYNLKDDYQEKYNISEQIDRSSLEKLILWINKNPLKEVDTPYSKEFYKNLQSLGYL
jgi:arylsulfatase A-like enzyme